jgi:hypothetical protein
MKNKTAFTICLFICLSFLTRLAWGEYEIVAPYQKGPVNVNLKIDKQQIDLSQTLNIEIETTAPQQFSVGLPEIKDTNEFRVISKKSQPDRIDLNRNIIKSITYRFEPALAGEFEIPALIFTFTEPNDTKAINIETEPVKIQVKMSLTADPNDPNKVNIADIETVVNPPYKFKLWIVGAIMLVVILLALVVWFNRQKPQGAEQVIIKLPHEIALEQIQNLLSRDLISKGFLKEFYGCLCDILRRYIEDRFDIKAPEQTTEEFLADLSKDSQLNQQDKDNLVEFLLHCDLVKFAKHTPEIDNINQSIDLAKDFISRTKQVPSNRQGGQL